MSHAYERLPSTDKRNLCRHCEKPFADPEHRCLSEAWDDGYAAGYKAGLQSVATEQLSFGVEGGG